MVTPDCSALPYIPAVVQRQGYCGIGHPALLPHLERLFWVAARKTTASARVYKQRPNLVQEIALPIAWHVPWPRVVLKHFGWRGRQHFLFSPMKRSKALKAYHTACYLLDCQLCTPLPLAAFEMRWWGFIQATVYVTAALPTAISLRKYCRTTPDGLAGMEEVLQLAARYTRHMHDSGVWHRDLSLGNFLLTGTPGQRQLYLVDLNRARRLASVPLWLRAVDLARMDLQGWQTQFLALYCEGRFTVQRMQGIVRWYERWRAWRQWVRGGGKPMRGWLGQQERSSK